MISVNNKPGSNNYQHHDFSEPLSSMISINFGKPTIIESFFSNRTFFVHVRKLHIWNVSTDKITNDLPPTIDFIQDQPFLFRAVPQKISIMHPISSSQQSLVPFVQFTLPVPSILWIKTQKSR